MSLIEYAAPWGSQPQEVTGAAARWIDRGLKSLYLLSPDAWQVNQVTGQIGCVAAGSGPTFVNGRLRTPGTAGNGATLEHGLPDTAFVTTGATILIGYRIVSGSVAWSLLYTTTGTWHGYYSDTAGVKFSKANDFTGLIAISGSVAFVHPAANNFRGSSGGSVVVDTATSYLDAALPATVALGWSRRNTNDNPAVAEFTHFAAFDSTLPDADFVELAINPWQLFEPRRIFVPVSAAAPSLPTLSASTFKPGTLTSGGWQPRITAT